MHFPLQLRLILLSLSIVIVKNALIAGCCLDFDPFRPFKNVSGHFGQSSDRSNSHSPSAIIISLSDQYITAQTLSKLFSRGCFFFFHFGNMIQLLKRQVRCPCFAHDFLFFSESFGVFGVVRLDNNHFGCKLVKKQKIVFFFWRYRTEALDGPHDTNRTEKVRIYEVL